jgi:hypothetical protein
MDCPGTSGRRACSTPPFAASACTSGDLVPTHHGDQWPSPRTSRTGKLGSTCAPRLGLWLPSLFQKVKRTSAPPHRPSQCPPRQMDEHLPGVSTRRDATSCPMTEYRQSVRRTVEYRLVGGETVECRQPAGGLARGGADGDSATREEGGFATR